jgi:hypothetical protein
MMNHTDDHLRLSDRERARARRRLTSAHRRGRIDAAELTERLDAVGTARTRGDLEPVIGDLLPQAASPSYRRGPGFGRFPFPFPLLPLVVIAIVVAATNHVPWIAIGVLAAVLVLTAPWRWSRRARWAC